MSHSFALFPFLKTSAPISIGDYTFRSTDDRRHLGAEEAEQVQEIAKMLFLQNELRIRSASYAVLPFIDLDYPAADTLRTLVRMQSVVAYCYAAPHDVFGDVFLPPENCSLVILSPGNVSGHLVNPSYHV